MAEFHTMAVRTTRDIAIAISLLSPSLAWAGSSDDNRWLVEVGDASAVCDCTAGTDCGCAVDIFMPPYAGVWNKYCDPDTQAQKEPSLRFGFVGNAFEVERGHTSCRLVEVVDYRKMERSYFVRAASDCTADAPASLIADYSYDSDKHWWVVRSGSHIEHFQDCSRGISTNVPN